MSFFTLMVFDWFDWKKNILCFFYVYYILLNNSTFYFIYFKFFRQIFFRFFAKKWFNPLKVKIFKPIFKINFFLNFNFRFKKKLKYIKYKFFKRLKKILFTFKRFRNFRRSMFFFLFRRKSRIRLKFLFSKYKNSYRMIKNYKKKKKKWWKKKKKWRKPYIFDLRRNYRQFWEKNREAINYFIMFRAEKQFQKTKYFSQFTTKTPLQMFNSFNHNVFSLLYFSNFFYSYNQIVHFLDNSFIYKNGLLVKSKYTIFELGDRLNIVFSKRYLFYSIFVHYLFYRKTRRLGYFHWKFIRFRFDFRKTKPLNPNKFFEKYIPYYSVNPIFLEFDYKSLTIIYLLSNKHLRNLNEFYLKYINYYFFRLYNWKYII